jgi:type I restriction enzyme M protein
VNYDNHDKASLNIFWLGDDSLEGSDNLPDPNVLAQEIADDLEAALEQLRAIATDLGGKKSSKRLREESESE